MHKTRLEAIIKAADQYAAARQDEAAAEDAVKCAEERLTDAQRRQGEATAELDRLTAQADETGQETVLVAALADLLDALPFDVYNGQVIVTGIDGHHYEFLKVPEQAKGIRLRLAEKEREIRSAILQARRVLQKRKG